MIGQSNKLLLAVLGGIIIGCAIAITVHILFDQFRREDTQSYVSPEISGTDTPKVYDANTLDTFVTSEENRSPTELTRHVLPVIDHLDREALEELLSRVLQPDENSRNKRTAKLVVNRLVELDPSSAFQSVNGLEYFKREWLMPVVMARWARVSETDAITAASTLTSDSLKKSAIHSILANSTGLDNQRVLDLATTLDMDSLVKQVLSEVQVRKMHDTPRQAFEFLLTDEVPDQDQRDIFNEVAEDWLQRAGTDAFSGLLDIMRSRVPGLYGSWSNLFDFKRRMCEIDIELVWKLLQTDYQDLRHSSLRNSILADWMEEDTDAAIAVLNELETKRPVDELWRDVIGSWTASNPSQALENVEKVPQGHQTHLYTKAIFRLALAGEIYEALRAFEQLETLEVNTFNAQYFLLMGWADHDVSAAIDWVLANTEKGSDFRYAHLRERLYELAHVDPVRALQVAVENEDLETADNYYSLPARVISTVAYRIDVDQAIALLQSRSESANAKEYSVVGEVLVTTGRETEAIQLGEQLPIAKQLEYFRQITERWYIHDPEALIERLSGLPNELVQRTVAREILDINSRRPLLTETEIELLREFVTEDVFR
ncbi:MAG: hypothetical protein OXG88_03360 [Gammaproteobacteria bacterium]|nr:hypothetical protein [Gammaproteobacteria bacterium]